MGTWVLGVIGQLDGSSIASCIVRKSFEVITDEEIAAAAASPTCRSGGAALRDLFGIVRELCGCFRFHTYFCLWSQ